MRRVTIPDATRDSIHEDTDVLIRRFRAVVERLERRYGHRSVAVAVARTEFLLSLGQAIGRLPADADHPGFESGCELAAWLRGWFWSAPSPPDQGFCQLLETSPALMQYDSTFYDAHFAEHGATIQSELCVVNQDAFTRLQPGRWYNYAVDEHWNLIVHTQPLALSDLALPHAYEPDRVVHPMLVHSTLRARAAGEIAFIGQRGRVSAVIANTKSGHFRPPPQSATVLRELCARRFGLRPLDILTFAFRSD